MRRKRHADDWFQRPSVLGPDVDHRLLAGHFAVSRDRRSVPPGWEARELDGWHLVHDEELPVLDLLDADGVAVGWILGHPVDVGARRLAVDATLPVAAGDAHFGDRVVEWLAAFGGRFATVVTRPRPFAVPDAFASLPILFDEASQSASSSPFLLDANGDVPDSPLVGELAVYRTLTYFPLGLTCHASARMVLPSHVVDLTTFEQRRVWPSAPPVPVDPATAVPRIAELMGATIEAAHAAGPAAMSLTAGGDSRMMLACSRDIAAELRLFTVELRDLTGATDVHVAGRIARRFGLQYRVLGWIEPSDADVRAFMMRTGALIGEYRGRRAAPTYAQLGGGAYLSGVGPEVARARKWRPDDGADTKLGPVDLLARVGLPAAPASVAACERWLAETPALSALDTIDLFFLEICHGGWAGPLTLGYPDAMSTTLYPFAQREILDLSLGLPHEYRRADRLRIDIVADRWPELAEFAINRGPLRFKVRYKARRASKMPAGAVRRLRRKLERSRAARREA